MYVCMCIYIYISVYIYIYMYIRIYIYMSENIPYLPLKTSLWTHEKDPYQSDPFGLLELGTHHLVSGVFVGMTIPRVAIVRLRMGQANGLQREVSSLCKQDDMHPQIVEIQELENLYIYRSIYIYNMHIYIYMYMYKMYIYIYICTYIIYTHNDVIRDSFNHFLTESSSMFIPADVINIDIFSKPPSRPLISL